MGFRAYILGAAMIVAPASASAASAAICVAMQRDLGALASKIETDDTIRADWVATFNDARDARNNAQADLELAQATGADAGRIEALETDYQIKRDAAAAAKAEIEALNRSLDQEASSFGEKRMIFNAKCVKD